MAGKRVKKSSKRKAGGIRTLPPKVLTSKQARGIKGGATDTFAKLGAIKGE